MMRGTKGRRAFRSVLREAHREGVFQNKEALAVGSYSEATHHDSTWIDAAVNIALKENDAALGAEFLTFDPNLTSTHQGHLTLGVVSDVLENNELASAFVDAEVVDGKSFFYFEDANEKGSDLEKTIESVLKEYGTVDIVARPGDQIDEGEESDYFITRVIFKESTVEAFESSMFTEEELSAITEQGDEDDDEDEEEDDEEEYEEDVDEAEMDGDLKNVGNSATDMGKSDTKVGSDRESPDVDEPGKSDKDKKGAKTSGGAKDAE